MPYNNIIKKKEQKEEACRARLFTIVYYEVFANKLLSCRAK